MTGGNTVRVTCRLTDVLCQKDMTQAELARQLGTHQPVVNNWCTGKKVPLGNTMFKVAQILKCKVGDIWAPAKAGRPR